MIAVYALLALAGLALPWYYNLQFIGQHGEFATATFIAAIFVNPASSSIGVDLLVGATAFTAWMIVEARRLGMRHWWIYVALTFLIAFAFACPLFLLMRERALRAQRA